MTSIFVYNLLEKIVESQRFLSDNSVRSTLFKSLLITSRLQIVKVQHFLSLTTAIVSWLKKSKLEHPHTTLIS